MLLLAGAGPALAQAAMDYGQVVRSLPGVSQAVTRYFSGPQGDIAAYVVAFDTIENAEAGYDQTGAALFDGYDAEPIEMGSLGSESRGYVLERAGTGGWTEILARDGAFVYLVSLLSSDSTMDMVGTGTAMVRQMIAAGAGDGMGDFRADGTSSGGLWDKVPSGDGDLPDGFSVVRDVQAYPQRSYPADSIVDFGALAGIQRVLGRAYNGDFAVLSTPESAPATTYQLSTLVAASLNQQPPIGVAPVGIEAIGDQVMAGFGTSEVDGLQLEGALVVVRSGSTVYLAAGLGVGVDTGVLDTTTAVVRQMVLAETGTGDEAYDETGHSTGGLWDVFPVDGDDVLAGMLAAVDQQLYP